MLQAYHSYFQVNCGMMLCLLTSNSQTCNEIVHLNEINELKYKEFLIEDSNESCVLLFVETIGLDGVASMALELKELINDTIDDLNDWLADNI